MIPPEQAQQSVWYDEDIRLGGTWWKPESGKHLVTLLNEGVKKPTVFKDKKTGEEKPTNQVSFKISVKKEIWDWDITYAKTEQSLFGQMLLLARHWGSLTGKNITLIVKASKTKKEFTIEEALPLMKKTPESNEGERHP